MQKKLMAVAVAGALAAPGVALAQTSTVQIGGSLTGFYYQATGHNPNLTKRTDVMESSESEMYIRGEEAVGGGTSAWFQCASSLDGMIGGATVASPATSGFGTNAFGICGRNSGMGLKGGWGNTWWGNWDLPQKLVQNRIRGWNGSTNAFTGGQGTVLFGGSASGATNPTTAQYFSPAAATGAATNTLTTTTSNNAASFSRRQANTWFYHSPVWSGFQFQGAFSAANEATAFPETMSLRPRLWSIAVHYDNGPLYLGAGYERHKDYNPSNFSVGATGYTGGSDNNWIIGAGYTFAGVFKLTGEYTRSKYDVTATTNTSTRGWWMFIDWAIAGPHSLKGQFGMVKDVSGTSTRTLGAVRAPASFGCASGAGSTGSCATSTGAKQYGLWYAYNMSKRTQLFAGFNKIDNDTNAIYSLGKTTPTAGATQTNIGIGFKHSF